jgi:DNA-binding response OmpR family regulator
LPQINVLYVEDHDLVLFTVKQLLELEGWRVRICRDGQTALKLLDGDEHYDLLILDVELPGVDGFDLLKRTRVLPQRRALPVIIFTALDCVDEALAAGAAECLKKPGGIKDLLSTCYRLLKLEPAAETNAAEPNQVVNRASNGD